MTLCLRSIRKHSGKYNLEVIVVDNGSGDGSLDYLRSIPWIRLLERPEERPQNWPLNVFTAWDRGLDVATGEYYLTMHSDVFVKSDNWLDPFLREISAGPNVAATGSWKLELENRLYALQKRAIGYAVGKAKSLLGLGKKIKWQQQNYPRDYCALYRRQAILDHRLTFCPVKDYTGGGYSIARQLWDAGFSTPVFPVARWPTTSITLLMARRRSLRKSGSTTRTSRSRRRVSSPRFCGPIGSRAPNRLEPR